jgi:hypothetical protein
MPDLTLGRILDHIGIVFEPLDPQQPVKVRRLVFRRDPQPTMIRIKRFIHGTRNKVPLTIRRTSSSCSQNGDLPSRGALVAWLFRPCSLRLEESSDSVENHFYGKAVVELPKLSVPTPP